MLFASAIGMRPEFPIFEAVSHASAAHTTAHENLECGSLEVIATDNQGLKARTIVRFETVSKLPPYEPAAI